MKIRCPTKEQAKFNRFLYSISFNGIFPFRVPFLSATLYDFNLDYNSINKLFKKWTVIQFRTWCFLLEQSYHRTCIIPEYDWPKFYQISNGDPIEKRILKSESFPCFGPLEEWDESVAQYPNSIQEMIANIRFTCLISGLGLDVDTLEPIPFEEVEVFPFDQGGDYEGHEEKAIDRRPYRRDHC